MSDKEKTLISHLLYFTGIVNNESVLVDYDYLKSLLKQYKDKDIRSLNAFYYWLRLILLFISAFLFSKYFIL